MPDSCQDPARPSCAGTISTCLGQEKGVPSPARRDGGGWPLRGDPSEQDPEPGSPRSDPRPHCQVLGSAPIGGLL